ncbi:MAG: uroporphyrinogen-III C-methyltransferase [Gammaproteobacteria bacterium]|nr:uroporphyrinogen-III C-methyltransferase [Gammaproteobacteria bacterium]
MSNKDKEQELEATEAEQQSADEAATEETEADNEKADALIERDVVADEPADTADAASSDDDVPAPAVPAKRRGNGVAWLALLVALIGVVAIGYTVSQDWLAEEDTATADAIARLESRLAAANDARDELAAQVDALATQDQGSNAEIDALRQEMDERVRLLSSLPERMSTLESSMASLAGISQSSRDAWLIAEAEYYMQIANAQLQLANNPELAALALRMADERVVQTGNPALLDVRRAISDELASLDVMQKPDIAGASMTLASLAQVVEFLPLAGGANMEGEAASLPDEEQSGLSRAWSSMKMAMSGLVRVTPPDQAKMALISPDAESFLRNNLALQLQSARLALLRGEQAVFEQSLDDTGAILSQYFDGDSAQVQSAQETLNEIRGSIVASSAPDISGSLMLLRQFRTLRESSQ